MITKKDILNEIWQKRLTEDDVYELYQNIRNSDQAAEVYELLGLTRTEKTAFAHSVGFAELATWRYQGWPDVCVHCQKKICVENFGWWAIEDKTKKESHRLCHLECLEKKASFE